MLTQPDFAEKKIIICNTTEKQKLSFLNDNIIVKDEDDKIILQNTCYKIFSLWIIGSITITSGILERSKKFAFSIYMFNYSFKCYGVWASITEGNFLLRTKQYQNEYFDAAKQIIYQKIHNQRKQLNTIRQKNYMQKRNIEYIDNYQEKVLTSTTINEIMGFEGMASKVYFEAWFYDLDWKGRQPRAKRDITNSLMDIGYTYLFNFIESLLNLYGFDIYKGILHQNFYQRKSLVCDLVEPFRIIIDRAIKNAYNFKQIKVDDFKIKNGQCQLEYKHSKYYSSIFLQAIMHHKSEIFIYIQSFYRWIIKEKPIDDFPKTKLLE